MTGRIPWPNPLRDEIVAVMRQYGRPISPRRIARITGDSIGATAYHVRALLAAGEVALDHEGRARGAVEHFYVLVSEPEVDQAETIRRLLSLCGALTVPSADGGYPDRTQIDDDARTQLEALLEPLRPLVRQIAAASTARVRRRRG